MSVKTISVKYNLNSEANDLDKIMSYVKKYVEEPAGSPVANLVNLVDMADDDFEFKSEGGEISNQISDEILNLDNIVNFIHEIDTKDKIFQMCKKYHNIKDVIIHSIRSNFMLISEVFMIELKAKPPSGLPAEIHYNTCTTCLIDCGCPPIHTAKLSVMKDFYKFRKFDTTYINKLHEMTCIKFKFKYTVNKLKIVDIRSNKVYMGPLFIENNGFFNELELDENGGFKFRYNTCNNKSSLYYLNLFDPPPYIDINKSSTFSLVGMFKPNHTYKIIYHRYNVVGKSGSYFLKYL